MLIGCSPLVTARDLRSPEDFANLIDRCAQSAAEAGWLARPATLVFPAHLSTLLYLTGEWQAVHNAPTLARGARLSLITHEPFTALSAWLNTAGADNDTQRRALFIRKTVPAAQRNRENRVLNRLQRTFGDIARRWKVSVIAGSLPLGAASLTIPILLPEGQILPTARLPRAQTLSPFERDALCLEPQSPAALACPIPRSGPILVGGLADLPPFPELPFAAPHSPISLTPDILPSGFGVAPVLRARLWDLNLNSPSFAAAGSTLQPFPNEQGLLIGLHLPPPPASSRPPL